MQDYFQLQVPNGDTVSAYTWENSKYSHQDTTGRKEILTKDLVKNNYLAIQEVLAIVIEINQNS